MSKKIRNRRKRSHGLELSLITRSLLDSELTKNPVYLVSWYDRIYNYLPPSIDGCWKTYCPAAIWLVTSSSLDSVHVKPIWSSNPKENPAIALNKVFYIGFTTGLLVGRRLFKGNIKRAIQYWEKCPIYRPS